MAEYYTFENKYPEGTRPSDPLRALPPTTAQPVLANVMRNTMHKSEEEMKNRPRIGSCCMGAQPCKTWVSYRPRYAGCGNMWMTWDQATNGKYMSDPDPSMRAYEIGEKAEGIWVANLNPVHYHQSLIRGAEWHAEMSDHPKARQLFAQFISSTLNPQSDPNTKRIDRIADTLPAITCKYGKPQYTSF